MKEINSKQELTDTLKSHFTVIHYHTKLALVESLTIYILVVSHIIYDYPRVLLITQRYFTLIKYASGL